MPIIKDTMTNSNGDSIVIYIDVDEHVVNDQGTPYKDLRGAENHVIMTAKDFFGSAMDLIHNSADQVFHTIEKMSKAARPAELDVQLSIKIDAAIGAVLAKAGSEAQIQVTMKWLEKEK